MADRVTVRTLLQKARSGQKISMCTAYDAGQAALVDAAGIDVILVGDSVANVVHGHDTTLPVTLDDMIGHCRFVRRGRAGCPDGGRALIVCDLPFGSYQAGPEQALRSAVRVMKEGLADAVKLEGGVTVAATVRGLVGAGVPVMGHVGLTPQSVHAFGGYRVQGRSTDRAREIVLGAEALEQAGAFSVVLECVPDRLAALITSRLSVPTIGIGAGPGCSGQVLVFHDLLGLSVPGGGKAPRFVKRYADLGASALAGLRAFREEVCSGAFPEEEHGYRIDDEQSARLDLPPRERSAD